MSFSSLVGNFMSLPPNSSFVQFVHKVPYQNDTKFLFPTFMHLCLLSLINGANLELGRQLYDVILQSGT